MAPIDRAAPYRSAGVSCGLCRSAGLAAFASGTSAMGSGRIALARRRPFQRGLQFCPQLRKVALHTALAPDHHVVVAGQAQRRQQITQQCAKPPLHPVAHHGITDPLGDGDAESLAPTPIGPRQQHKTGPRHPQTRIRRQKILARRNGLQFGTRRGARSLRRNPFIMQIRNRGHRSGAQQAQAESFLRPRARRAANTLRPPTVAERERKPWRRARTSRLG